MSLFVEYGVKASQNKTVGLEWSELIANPFGTSTINSIANIDGVAIAGGNGGKIACSTDKGLTWGSLITNPFETYVIQSIANIDGVAIAVGDDGRIARSV
jgi:hypothetical protein